MLLFHIADRKGMTIGQVRSLPQWEIIYWAAYYDEMKKQKP